MAVSFAGMIHHLLDGIKRFGERRRRLCQRKTAVASR
jgi:hypothetical protein